MYRFLIYIALMIFISIPTLASAGIVLASGAGYRAVVDALVDRYEQKTGNSIERIFGNMARVTTQARVSGSVDLVLGDAVFLEKSKLPFTTLVDIGKGQLVAAYAKDKEITSQNAKSIKPQDALLSPTVTRIALADKDKAIYGKAAMEFLQNEGLYEKVESKLLMVSTVPQAASYLISGEVDVALINLIHARKIEEHIGGYSLFDEKSYSPIRVIIGRLDTNNPAAEGDTFLHFLQTDEAKNIIINHGM